MEIKNYRLITYHDNGKIEIGRATKNFDNLMSLMKKMSKDKSLIFEIVEIKESLY